MTTTLRISNIAPSTTADALIAYFRDKGIRLSVGHEGHGISLVKSEDDRQHAVISLRSNADFKRALSMSYKDKKLDNRLLALDSDFDGFTVLSGGSQSDVIALHGLNGHAFNTWEYRNKKGYSFMWLRDSLPECLPDARVMVYGYNANVIFEVGTDLIRSFAETFLERLYHMRRESGATERPLLLIGHSMGGLVIKQALIIAKNNSRYQSILNSVRGILFLGTPHQGGSGVDLAKFVANFLRPFIRNVRMDLVKALHPRSMILFDLTNDFRQLLDARHIKIATLYESKATKIGFFRRAQIVDKLSATLGVVGESRASINANHVDMCKFRDSFDKSLVVAVQVIKELCGAIFLMTAPAILPQHELNGPCIESDRPIIMQSDGRIPATRQRGAMERQTTNVTERGLTPEPATHIDDYIALPHAYEDRDQEPFERAAKAASGSTRIRDARNAMEPTVESVPRVMDSSEALGPLISSSAAQNPLVETLGLTLRISNINESTTEDNLKTYFADKDLQLSDDHAPIFFTKGEDNGRKRTTVSLSNEDIFKRAISLTRAQRKLDGLVLEFDPKFLGFTVFSEGTEVDIIALHGMNGHAFTTFEYREEDYSFMWLRDALSIRIPKARIMVYGYDANVVSNVSVGRIRTYAETFMQKLRLIRKDANRPLILIGHALGGLVIKQALILPDAEGLLDPIVNAVCGVIFMATPHQGLKGVDDQTFAKNFYGASGVHFRSDLIAEQEAKTMVLFDLTNDFKELIARRHIPIRTLYETRKTKVGDSDPIGIVEEQSARLGVAGEHALGINADHINVCKFKPGDESLLQTIILTEELCNFGLKI